MFDWYNYFELAKKLKQRSVTVLKEACLRSAVSRAYYALYHIALSHACSGRIQPTFSPSKTGLDHQALAKYYRERGRVMQNYNITKIGVELGRVYTNRIKCDYEDTIKNIKKVTIASLKEAKSAINLVLQ